MSMNPEQCPALLRQLGRYSLAEVTDWVSLTPDERDIIPDQGSLDALRNYVGLSTEDCQELLKQLGHYSLREVTEWERLTAKEKDIIPDQGALDALREFVGLADDDVRTIPELTRKELEDYARYREPVGSFLRAVLEDKLTDAVLRADSENRRVLPQIVQFVYHHLPTGCHGSPEAYRDWVHKTPRIP